MELRGARAVRCRQPPRVPAARVGPANVVAMGTRAAALTVTTGHDTAPLDVLREMVRDIAETRQTGPAPDTVLVPPTAVRPIDKLRVRYGWMPISPDGERYAARRRRMARKKRRGWS